MANNHVQWRYATRPKFSEINEIIETLQESTPQPTISMNIKIQGLPESKIEMLLTILGEHGIDAGATLTAVFEEGQQLTFWTEELAEVA